MRAVTVRTLLFAAGLASADAAFGNGTATEGPPPPPSVDFSALPATADVQKKSPDGKDHPVHARLLNETTAIAAGTTGHLGLHLTQQKDWHTYWKSPGDIGIPTEIAWTMPGTLTAAPHAFPVPQRFELDGIVSFGYENAVLLISELTVPADTKPGIYDVAAHASWLVCQSSCIPGDADLVLPVEVVAAGTAVTPSPYAPLFDHYAAQHPTSAAAVDAFTTKVVLSASAIHPNEPFQAAFVLHPKPGHTFDPLEDGPGTWPTFTPVVGPDWALNAEKPPRMSLRPDGSLAIVFDGDTFEPDPLPPSEALGALLQVKVNGAWVRTEVDAQLPLVAAGTAVAKSESPVFAEVAAPAAAAAGPTVGAAPEGAALPAMAAADTSLGATAMNLLLALVGGLLLNIMPCVLPVLTLKLYSLVEQTDITPREQKVAGLAYSAGVVASFVALATAVVVLRSAFGLDVGWGSQFQYPAYVAALATIVFGFGLSLFGVYEIPTIGAQSASEAASKEGPVGYFFTGVFATLLATPCSAPFLGTAVAFAFSAPTALLFAIFVLIGVGLALPFFTIAFVPALYKLLPRPGAWMDGFKQLLGFSLMATTIWLVDVLSAEIGPDRVTGFLAFLMCLAIGLWVFGRWGGVAGETRNQLVSALVGGVIAAAGGAYFLDLRFEEAEACGPTEVDVAALSFAEHIPWQPFSAASVDQTAGRTVFVDFTADWCLTCKVNEKAIINTQTVRDAMARCGVVPLQADWTRQDAEISQWLQRFGKAGVPFYLVLPADRGQAPIPLGEVVSPEGIVAAFDQAGCAGTAPGARLSP